MNNYWNKLVMIRDDNVLPGREARVQGLGCFFEIGEI